MIDVKYDVKKALDGIEGVRAFFYFPNNFATLPCISYYEANNAPNVSADDDEYLSEIIYVVDVWGKSSEIVSDIAIKVDSCLKAIGFRREFSHDISNPESKVRQKTMRFKLIK